MVATIISGWAPIVINELHNLFEKSVFLKKENKTGEDLCGGTYALRALF